MHGMFLAVCCSSTAGLERGSIPAQACMQKLFGKARQGTNPGARMSLCSIIWSEKCLGVASGQGLVEKQAVARGWRVPGTDRGAAEMQCCPQSCADAKRHPVGGSALPGRSHLAEKHTDCPMPSGLQHASLHSFCIFMALFICFTLPEHSPSWFGCELGVSLPSCSVPTAEGTRVEPRARGTLALWEEAVWLRCY